APAATLRGELVLVNQAQRQHELTVTHPVKSDAGFDLIVGNPPFVTARNAEKRELYRGRWPRVCHMKFLLVYPFFELSFDLLRPDGQLGFIVSNAFAKREFGKPLIEDFFPTIDLQKIVDCSGLMFPGHGTPTCIVFGAQRKPDEKSPIRVAAILPGGGDLRASPEESPLWHTLAEQHDKPGFTNSQVIVAERDRKEMGKHPWTLDSSTSATNIVIEAASAGPLLEFLADEVGVCTMTNADPLFVVPPDCARRHLLPSQMLRYFQEGEDVKNWELRAASVILIPYDSKTQPLAEKELGSEVLSYLRPFKPVLESRLSFGNKTFKELGRPWFS